MFSNKLAIGVRALTLATALAVAPAAVLVVSAPAAHAEGGKEWTGGGDGHLWSDDKNWSGEEAPQDGDNVTINSPDEKGNTVHVVGVPDISLGDFSVTAAGNAVVSVEGGSVGVSGAFSWTSGTLGVNVNLSPLAHGSIGSGGMKYLQGDISAGIGSGLTMSGVSGTSGLMMYAPHSITIGTGAGMATIGTNNITAQRCCVDPAKFVVNGILEMGPGSLNLSTVELDVKGRVDATFGPDLTVEKAPAKITGARFSGTGSLRLGDNSETTVAGTLQIGGKYVVEQAGGTLQGTATLTNGGIWKQTGGTLYGTLTNAQGNLLQISGENAKTFGVLTSTKRGTLINHGVTEISGPGELDMGVATRLRNETDGTMRLVPGATIDGLSCCVNPALLENHGDLSVTAPATHEETNHSVTITRAGLFSDAPITITPEQTLSLATGPSQLANGAVIGGGGTLAVGDTLVASGNIPVQANSTILLHDGADVTGDGLTLGGTGSTINWDRGAVRGIVDLTEGTTLNLRSADEKYVGAPVAGATRLTTHGATVIEAGVDSTHRNLVSIDPGQRWVNAGAMTVQGNVGIGSRSCCVTPARLENAARATLVFTGDAGTTVEDQGVEIRNLGGKVTAKSGIVNVRYPSYVQESGTLTVAQGATFGQTNFSSVLQLLGGTVTGTGMLTGTVDNTGANVAPGASAARGAIGTLSVAGEYDQGPGGHLTVDVTRTGSDQLASSGAVHLAGILTGAVKGATPNAGAKATVITGSTIVGTPDCVFTTGTTERQFAASVVNSTLVLTAGDRGPTGCDVFTPLTPARLDQNGASVAAGQDVLVQVAGVAGVPATGVDAVSLTASVDGAAGDGVLSVGGASVPTGQTVRYHAGQPASAATTVRLDADGRVRLHVTGSAATVRLDVAGWYGDAQLTTGGGLFHPIAPAPARSVKVSSAQDSDLVVTGRDGVPTTVTSVTLAVEVRGATVAGSIAVLPGGATAGSTVTQSFGPDETVEALVTLQPVDGAVRLHLSGGTARVAVRTLGYTTDRKAGGSYLKLAGPTTVDSFGMSTQRTLDSLAWLGGVSRYGAQAYVLAVHAGTPSAPLKVLVGSAAAGAEQIPTVSVRAAGAEASGAVVVTGDSNDYLSFATSKGTARAQIDLQGWYVG